MRAALWLLMLFAIAAAVALFAGNNQGSVTVFWPPWRVDFSLNLALLLLASAFAVLYAAARGLAVLFDLPRRAWRWRVQQKERALHGALLDALSHLLAGRFLRARKATAAVLAQEKLLQSAAAPLPGAARLRALAHLLAAQGAHALQDRAGREDSLRQALREAAQRDGQAMHEGAQLCAARWALDDRDPEAALDWLEQLPPGAGRRTLALRFRLKAARQARQNLPALETARLLAKHRAFPEEAARSLVRGLAAELLDGTRDLEQLPRVWQMLEASERAMPELALQAAQRCIALGGAAAVAREWLLPVWQRMLEEPETLNDSLRVKLVRALVAARSGTDAAWLAHIEAARQRNPRDARLQYLAGMVCMERQLWGKAQQLLSEAVQGLREAELRRSAWLALAELAELRDDAPAAAKAWKQAAQA